MSIKVHGKSEVPTVFSQLQSSKDLQLYLDDNARLANSAFLYHYTTIPTLINMIHSRTWHLGNAKEMNDKLEYKSGDNTRWKNLFFASFMGEDKESIGMWSMYSQPWEKGVKLAIPRNAVRQWLNGITELQEISIENYMPTGKRIVIADNDVRLWISAVAYSNEDSMQGKKDIEKISWSNQINAYIKHAGKISELTGYVKDMAWSYEKEIRIKAEFQNKYQFRRVAITLSDEIINQMVITASPLFSGNLEDSLNSEIIQQVKTDKSIFTERLNIRTICQDCNLKLQVATH